MTDPQNLVGPSNEYGAILEGYVRLTQKEFEELRNISSENRSFSDNTIRCSQQPANTKCLDVFKDGKLVAVCYCDSNRSCTNCYRPGDIQK